ncbi:hypothetical protein JQ002_000282 [Campylobacter coli]|nr:hypothetical protein [Campylobacter coli]
MGILKGTLPALLTPYKDDGSINEKEFIHYCEFGISKGLNGLFCNGSAGDSQALSIEEQVKLMRLTKEVAKNNVPIITGICRRKNKISIWKNKTSIKVEILFFYKA